jgi:drug/metabolite transporter (DMT)-like permease
MLNDGAFIVLTMQSPVWLKASEAVVITYRLPVWASPLACPMLGERPTVLKLVALVLAMGGVALLVGVDLSGATWEKLPAAGMGPGGRGAVRAGHGAGEEASAAPAADGQRGVAGAAGDDPRRLAGGVRAFREGGVSTGGWVAIAYISTIPLTVGYLAWFQALRMVPASTAETTVLVSPLVVSSAPACCWGRHSGRTRSWLWR